MHYFIETLLVLSLFLYSGIQKLNNIDKTIKLLQSKINGLPDLLANLLVYCAILIEVVATLIILYSSFKDSKNKYARLSIISLIIFTVLATILFHLNDTSDLLKNVSVMGGLILLYSKF
jgi:uncharacterized membrane protein YphA (DoxX/SURF4 family)